MSISIDTRLTGVVDETGVRGQQICDLITLYIPFLAKVYYGHRPIGAEDPQVQFPCAMVENMTASAKMETMGRYRCKWVFNIYFYLMGDNRDDLLVKQSEVMESLVKLFSNNALNDQGSGNTNKFKTNPGYWLTSEMTGMTYSSTWLNAREERPKYARAGMMVLELDDVVTK